MEYITLICALISFAGVLVNNIYSNNKTRNTLDKNQAILKEQIQELTREVRMHNDFATRVPILEEKIERLERYRYERT